MKRNHINLFLGVLLAAGLGPSFAPLRSESASPRGKPPERSKALLVSQKGAEPQLNWSPLPARQAAFQPKEALAVLAAVGHSASKIPAEGRKDAPVATPIAAKPTLNPTTDLETLPVATSGVSPAGQGLSTVQPQTVTAVAGTCDGSDRFYPVSDSPPATTGNASLDNLVIGAWPRYQNLPGLGSAVSTQTDPPPPGTNESGPVSAPVHNTEKTGGTEDAAVHGLVLSGPAHDAAGPTLNSAYGTLAPGQNFDTDFDTTNHALLNQVHVLNCALVAKHGL